MYIHVQEGSVTVEKKCNQRSLKNVIKRAFGKLDNIFQNDCLKKKKNSHNSQRMSDSFYHITESNELKEKNKVAKHIHLAIYVSHHLA